MIPAGAYQRRQTAALERAERDADVLDTIRRLGPITARGIVEDTGRIRSAVSLAIEALRAGGLVEAVGVVRTTKPANLYVATNREE